MMRLNAHPIWRDALAGRLAIDRLRGLMTRLYPAGGGPGRYMFVAKVSQIDREDGERLFRDLYEAAHEPAADADAGWRRAAAAIGVTAERLDHELANPTPEAVDLVDVVREHSLKTSPAAAAAVAWALERKLPALWGGLADALKTHYRAGEESLGYLRFQASRTDQAEAWAARLIERYFVPADPATVYDARRAAREVAWAWTALTEGGPG
jgi:pyrroloquinoline quinone (PQQ) biosynthesis protein C